MKIAFINIKLKRFIGSSILLIVIRANQWIGLGNSLSSIIRIPPRSHHHLRILQRIPHCKEINLKLTFLRTVGLLGLTWPMRPRMLSGSEVLLTARDRSLPKVIWTLALVLSQQITHEVVVTCLYFSPIPYHCIVRLDFHRVDEWRLSLVCWALHQ